MNLQSLYETDGPAGLKRLEAATGAAYKYLYQCATGRKTPSPKLAVALVKADSRLTLDSIYQSIPQDRKAA